MTTKRSRRRALTEQEIHEELCEALAAELDEYVRQLNEGKD